MDLIVFIRIRPVKLNMARMSTGRTISIYFIDFYTDLTTQIERNTNVIASDQLSSANHYRSILSIVTTRSILIRI